MAASSILAEPSPKETGLEAQNLRLLLEEMGWQPVEIGRHFRCGDGWEGPGWRLHIATTRSYFRQIVNQIVPLLGGRQVPICLFRDYESGNTIVNGGYGVELQGKALSILPGEDQEAATIADLLVTATMTMKGPDIPGAYHLGGRVYAEYVGVTGISSFHRIGSGSRGLLRFFQRLAF